MRRTILLSCAVMAVLMFAMVGAGAALADTVFSTSDSPTTKEDCKNGGYAEYGFKNQGQCIKAVNHAPPADTTAPEITVTGPEGTTMRSQATYTMSANEPVTWECTATFPVELPPDVVYEPCTGGSYTFFTEWDGTYVFTFKATDAAGNTTTVTKTLVRDTPYVEILNSPGRDYPVISGDSYSFQFETSGPVDQVQCRLWVNANRPDAYPYEDWQDCTSPKTYTNLPDGAYQFEVAATALATTDHGEWSMIDQATFTVDTTPPADTIPPEITVTGPEGQWSELYPVYTLATNEPVSWQCTFTFTPFGGTTPTQTGSDPCSTGTKLWGANQDGIWVFTFKATDAAGNTSTVTKTLLLDTTP